MPLKKSPIRKHMDNSKNRLVQLSVLFWEEREDNIRDAERARREEGII